MAKPKKVSFIKLAHDVVYESDKPLTAAAIQERVNAITPITTKNPKSTIRNAISNSRIIVSTGDGRYGWKPRVLNGSVIRHTLSEAELVEKVLHWESDVWDALWPTFFAKQMYRDRSPARVALPNETVSEMPLVHYGHGTWGTSGSVELWIWLGMVQPEVGDHLLFRVIDGEERWFAVTYEARADCDEGAIAERNQAIIDLGRKMLQRPYGTMDSEVTTAALATGLYQHEVPPDSFARLWAEIRREEEDEPLLQNPDQQPDPLLSALFERPAQVYDPTNPPDLPNEYNPRYGSRRPRPSRKAQTGSVKAWTFRVYHRAVPDVWADIQLAEDQTLEDLHLLIQQTFRWDDDHLYSFFIGDIDGKKVSEVGCPWADRLLHTHQVEIGTLGLAKGRFLLYLFDYGDNHEFDVAVIDLNPLSPKGKYPRILSYPGPDAPEQYPDYDEEEW